MKVGYDGKRAVSNMTGLGNYSRLVIEEVGKIFMSLREDEGYEPEESYGSGDDFGMHIADPKAARRRASDLRSDWKLLVYTPEMSRNSRLEPLHRLENVEFRFPPAQGFKGSLWRTFGITNNLAADRPDIYHGLSNELPLNIRSAGVKSVVTIHDLIYRRMPECYKPIDRLLYDFKYSRACRNADRIIAVSNRTKQDIVEIYGINPDKIEVIYQGCDDIFRRDYGAGERKEVRERLHLPARYIVQVGTVEKRKNLELTLRALSELPEEIALVAVGGDNGGYKSQMKKLARELCVEGRTLWLEGVDFHDLPIIYGEAEASVYPSRYEGFGIPVIESIECRTPVVAATGSCLEEAGGPGALYVNHDNTEELAEALRCIIYNKELRTRLTEDGKRHVRKFDNVAMAEKIVDCYRRLLRE